MLIHFYNKVLLYRYACLCLVHLRVLNESLVALVYSSVLSLFIEIASCCH
jgi:hypothetical protein